LLLSWIGQCDLVHKLDQLVSPPSAKSHYGVPDLVAVFRYGGRLVPVLIEVKASYNKHLPTLSWKSDYLNELREYAEILHLPFLVAWKWKTGRIWTLFEAKHFKFATKHYHISFQDAMEESLLCQLAGDFSVDYCPNVGLHFVFHMDKKLASKKEGNTVTQEWLMTATDAFFTNGKMQRVDSVNAGLWALFVCSDIEDKSEFGQVESKQSFVIREGVGQFAHRMLPILIQWRLGAQQPLRWRRIRGSNSIPIE
jgi:hypothetical protein